MCYQETAEHQQPDILTSKLGEGSTATMQNWIPLRMQLTTQILKGNVSFEGLYHIIQQQLSQGFPYSWSLNNCWCLHIFLTNLCATRGTLG